MLRPWEAASRCEGYRAKSCTFLLCWNGCVSDMGPLTSCTWLWGPCQSKARVLLAFYWKYRIYLYFYRYFASFASKCRSHFSCSIQADLRVEVLQKEKRCTEASFWNTENPRMLPRPKYNVILEDILEELSSILYQRHGSLLVVAVLLPSLEVPVSDRVTEYQLHFVVYEKYLASFPWMCAVMAEINTSVHKLLL